MDNKYSSVPVWKLVSGFDDTDIPVYFDVQELTSENLNASELSFYPRQAASIPGANYQRNPLPKNLKYDIPGISIALATGSLREKPADSIGLVSLLNSFVNSRLLLETNQREKLLNRHLIEMTDAKTAEYGVHGSDDAGTADGLTRVVDFPIFRTLRIADPIHFDEQESFDINLKLQDDSGIPAEADYTSLGQGPVHVAVAMQVSFKD